MRIRRRACGEEGECAPAAMGSLGDQPRASWGAPVGACHVGLGPSLVDEDEPGDVGPILRSLLLRCVCH
jgi:hypothetical protein